MTILFHGICARTESGYKRIFSFIFNLMKVVISSGRLCVPSFQTVSLVASSVIIFADSADADRDERKGKWKDKESVR